MKICSIDGCDTKVRCKGLCIKHYRRLKRHGYVHEDPPVRPSTCSADDCNKPHDSLGYCKLHASRVRKGRDVNAPIIPAKAKPGDFWKSVNKTDGCWVWTGHTDRDGYGRSHLSDSTVLAHRISWEETHGPISKGSVIDHLCHNTACVNPDHLREVTQFENMQNRKGPVAGNSSGYLNVNKTSRPGVWHVIVKAYGVSYRGGYFTDLEEANKAAIALRAKVHNQRR